MKHNWVCYSPGVWESYYTCTRCQKIFIERHDMGDRLPTTKCNYTQYKLFVDDLRNPEKGWEVARSTQEAKTIIELNGLPTHISLDHDLGIDDRAIDLVKWLIEQDMENGWNIIDNVVFTFHSANPIGRKNMIDLLASYTRFITRFKEGL